MTATVLMAATASARAQPTSPLTSPAATAQHADSMSGRGDTVPTARGRFARRFALGAATSLLVHESMHIVAQFAMGGRPSFGFDRGRPTIYSAIDYRAHPAKQFIFSGAGMTGQLLLNETILGVPHQHRYVLERGVLAGGIGTVLFYITLGRSGSVSDVEYMARTSRLSKDQVSLIFGGMAALQTVRIWRDDRYARFFATPTAQGGMRVGVQLRGDPR